MIIISSMKRILLVAAVLTISMACRRDAADVPPNQPATEAASHSPETTAPEKTPGTVSKAPAGQPFAGYPPIENACASDGDCQLVLNLRTDPSLTGCCRECNSYVAGSRAWASTAIEACNAAGRCSNPLLCPSAHSSPFLAACDQGRCVVRRNPAVWRDAR